MGKKSKKVSRDTNEGIDALSAKQSQSLGDELRMAKGNKKPKQT